MFVSVIIPAYQAANRLAATLVGARQIPSVTEIIVVDDGSRDSTAEAARAAGADRVISLPRNRGKGHALRAGVEVASGDTLLFLDSDLGETAARAGALLDAIAGRQAMSIAVLPSHGRGGGFGLAKGLAAAVIRLLTGLRVSAPLSGQRALPAAVVRHLGLAPRWAVEVALTCEAAHLGIPIIEVPVDLDHRHTGRDAAGFGHRFQQFSDVLRYALLVGYGLGWPALTGRQVAARVLVWVMGFAVLLGLAWRANVGAFLLAQCVFWVAVSTLLWLPSLWFGAVILKCRKTNYLGRTLPGAAGLLLPIVALLGVAIVVFDPLALGPWSDRVSLAYATVLLTFGAVGLLDDLLASRGRQARGLRGHLTALRQGRLTTGAIKALGGLAGSLAAAALLQDGVPQVWLWLCDGLLIALAANLVNLLDLRPGRALKGFALLAGFPLALQPIYPLPLVFAPLLASTLVLAPSDLSGRAMLGDVGANTLGGVAGLMLAMALTPTPAGRVAALVALVAIHVYCERASLTDLIARNRVLRFLDQLGTRHLPPLEEE
jgi:glycosyltransferase involved in cell wall biosynthesis